MDELNTEHIEEPAVMVEEVSAAVEAEPTIEVPEVTVEPAQAHEPEAMPEPVHVDEPKAYKPAANQSVSGNGIDEVFLVYCIYKNAYARKSLSIHHLQRRLIELGFNDADADKDGWLGDETVSAIKKFQASKGLEETGSVDATTLTKIFEGDHNVQVVL